MRKEGESRSAKRGGERRGRKRLEYEEEEKGREGRRLECKAGRGEEGRISYRPALLHGAWK